MIELVAKSQAELPEIAAQLLPLLKSKKVMALYGSMGAGKTTLVSELVHQLGGNSTTSSPSYAIHHQYETSCGLLNHFDFYRINHLSEAYYLGAEDIFFSGEMCVVEWPEKVEPLFPEVVVKISIEVNGDNHRIFRELI